MKFSRGMARAWFDIDANDDIERIVDELNSVPLFMVMLVFFWLIRFVRNTETLKL